MRSVLLSITALLLTANVQAAETVKIGMITTLSTKAGYLGEDIRDGFNLAVKMGGGKLGGVSVEVLVDDDGGKPAKGKQIAERFMKKDSAQILTGIVFSNVALAVVPGVTKDGAFYISPNAGPSQLAGKTCHANYFNVAWQNDNLHEGVGKYMDDAGYLRVSILAPNYPAGKDALAGFKRFFKGEIASETYTKLGQSDYAAELAKIRDAQPDGVFFFLPGGMGINFLKQYSQAGLKSQIPVFGPAFSFDERILAAVGAAARGVHNSSQWSHDLDNSANKSFVAEFRKEFGRTPTLYASQGYDAANLIGSALSAVKGDLGNKDAFRSALKAAKFDSVRGQFKFGPNHHPIQDIYIRKVNDDGEGGFTNETVKKVLENHSDAYAVDCKL